MGRLKTIIATIIKFRIAIIAVLFIGMVISGYHTFHKLSVDNSLGIWFLEDDPSYRAYFDFQENFGSDEIFIAMLPVENAIGDSEISSLKILHQRIESLPYVQTSYSLAKAKYPIYTNNTIAFIDLYNSKRSEKSLKNLFLKLPNITSQLVSKDFKHQFFYIQLNPTSTIEKKRQVIASEIRAIIQSSYKNYALTGPPVLNEAYSKGIYKESMTFGVLTVLVITLMLLFLLPSKRYLIISLTAVALPKKQTYG